MKIAADGQRGHSEAQRLVTEKIVAAVEAQAAGAAAACAGGDGHRVTKKVMGIIKSAFAGMRALDAFGLIIPGWAPADARCSENPPSAL
jgi:hypothetical protein